MPMAGRYFFRFLFYVDASDPMSKPCSVVSQRRPDAGTATGKGSVVSTCYLFWQAELELNHVAKWGDMNWLKFELPVCPRRQFVHQIGHRGKFMAPCQDRSYRLGPTFSKKVEQVETLEEMFRDPRTFFLPCFTDN